MKKSTQVADGMPSMKGSWRQTRSECQRQRTYQQFPKQSLKRKAYQAAQSSGSGSASASAPKGPSPKRQPEFLPDDTAGCERQLRFLSEAVAAQPPCGDI